MADRFTEDQIAKFKEAFSLFDRDNDGLISEHEIGTVMRSLGKTPTEKEINELVAGCRKKENGKVDFAEFLVLMASKVTEVTPGDVVNAFRVFDKEGNGFVNAEEMRHVLTTLGEKLNDEEIEVFLREANVNSQGFIDYQAFAQRMSQV